MGKSDDGIRIYLRLRPPATSQQSSMMSAISPDNEPCDYDIEHEFNNSTWKLHLERHDGGGDHINNTREDYKFSFRRVLEPSVTQETVFNVVAKDCVMSVLEGYNSTIFAYGQTGSGKTFSITGGSESYDDRGIIPRALAMVYDEIGKRKDVNWTVSLSYLQIYNDKGQDLLNHGKDAKTLDELPVVTVHEGEDEIILKNLDQHYSPTLSDALSLLFLGDTNRLYCETPMNKTSSRSHCVFTISLEGRAVGSSVVRRSKLNLVDLAGSERVSKTGVDGNLLTEAKYINLSLHYLEHVIIALSEQAKGKRDHVPYRNSLMTMVLRDSLGPNCRTSMLATVHTAKGMLPETISTCQFAQRVALIRQNAQVNEETDPVLLVKKLRAEIAQLKDRLNFAEKGSGGAADRELSEDERHMCELIVENYLRSPDVNARIEGFEGDLARIYHCFSIMKNMVSQGGPSSGGGVGLTKVGELETQLEDYKAQVDALQISLQQKENEMTMLFDMLHKTNGPKTNAQTQTVGDDGSTMPGGDPLEAARRVAAAMRGSAAGTASSSLSASYAVPASAAAAMYANSAILASSPSSPGVYSVAAGAAAPAPVVDPQVTSMAMAKVNTLVERGKLNDAQATAVTEFLKDKEETQKNGGIAALADAEMLQNRATAFEVFKQSYKGYEKVEEMKRQLKVMYEACKMTGREANVINDRIKHIKKEILKLRAERAVAGVEEVSGVEQNLLDQLREEKQGFTTYIEKVKKQKEEIQSVEAFLERSKEQLSKNFEDWMNVRQRQVQLAMQAMHSDPSSAAPAGKSSTGGENMQTGLPPTSASGTLSAAPAMTTMPTVVMMAPPPPALMTTAAPSLSFPTTIPGPPPPSSAPHQYGVQGSGNGNTNHDNHDGAGSGGRDAGSPPGGSWHPSSAPNPSAPSPPSHHAFAASAKELSAMQRMAIHQPTPAPSSSSSFPQTSSSPTGWGGIAPGVANNNSNSSSALGWGGGVVSSPSSDPSVLLSGRTRSTNAFHLEPLSPVPPAPGAALAPPLPPTNAQPTLSGGGYGGGLASSSAPRPSALGGGGGGGSYAPLPRSTGDPTADQELAALYRAREAMRRNLGG